MTSFRLDTGLLATLREMSEDQNRDMIVLVETALEEYFHQERRPFRRAEHRLQSLRLRATLGRNAVGYEPEEGGEAGE